MATGVPARSIRSPLRLALVATASVTAVAGVLLLPDPDASQIAATSLLAVTIGAYFIRVAQLRAELRFGTASILASMRSIVGGALALLAAAVAGPTGAAAGMALGFILSIGLTARRSSGPPAEMVEAGTRTDQRAYGLASMVIAVALFLLAAGDRFILSVFRPLEEVGVYAAVYTIVDLVVRLAPSVVTVAIRTPVFRAWDRAGSRVLTAWVGSLFTVVLWGSSIVSVLLEVTSRWWLPNPVSQALVAPIAFGLTAGAVATGIGSLYAASEMQPRLALLIGVSAALNIGLNVLWVPTAGPQGSACCDARELQRPPVAQPPGARPPLHPDPLGCRRLVALRRRGRVHGRGEWTRTVAGRGLPRRRSRAVARRRLAGSAHRRRSSSSARSGGLPRRDEGDAAVVRPRIGQ